MRTKQHYSTHFTHRKEGGRGERERWGREDEKKRTRRGWREGKGKEERHAAISVAGLSA